MPTWRGVVGKVETEEQVLEVQNYLLQMDEMLSDDELLLVRLHPFGAKAIDYNKFRHICAFPDGYDPYDVLNMVDCLITDYSSVFFDFSNTGKKIVLFVYDKEQYLDDRGIYVQLDSFPFPQVQNVSELVK